MQMVKLTHYLQRASNGHRFFFALGLNSAQDRRAAKNNANGDCRQDGYELSSQPSIRNTPRRAESPIIQRAGEAKRRHICREQKRPRSGPLSPEAPPKEEKEPLLRAKPRTPLSEVSKPCSSHFLSKGFDPSVHKTNANSYRCQARFCRSK